MEDLMVEFLALLAKDPIDPIRYRYSDRTEATVQFICKFAVPADWLVRDEAMDRGAGFYNFKHNLVGGMASIVRRPLCSYTQL